MFDQLIDTKPLAPKMLKIRGRIAQLARAQL